jgi:hypothetical protein
MEKLLGLIMRPSPPGSVVGCANQGGLACRGPVLTALSPAPLLPERDTLHVLGGDESFSGPRSRVDLSRMSGSGSDPVSDQEDGGDGPDGPEDRHDNRVRSYEGWQNPPRTCANSVRPARHHVLRVEGWVPIVGGPHPQEENPEDQYRRNPLGEAFPTHLPSLPFSASTDHPRCAVPGAITRASDEAAPRLQSVQSRARQPVLWVPLTAPARAPNDVPERRPSPSWSQR